MSEETTKRYEMSPVMGTMILIWANYIAVSAILLLGAKAYFSQTIFLIVGAIVLWPFYASFYILHLRALKKFNNTEKSSES